ncbi:MAG: SRPBCC domain-containing protein [Ferruginibacter sp.]|nr:SRPBCC domain-containing protein [Ferruginibacter sp.]
MENQSNSITAEIKIEKPVDCVWQLWTTPADIVHWNIPFDDWHSPKVENDLKVSGKFFFRMEKKDGSEGFDHYGTYDKIVKNQLIEYTVSDGRKSVIKFISDADTTLVVETFEPERETPVEIQKDFCYSGLKKFKRYSESK